MLSMTIRGSRMISPGNQIIRLESYPIEDKIYELKWKFYIKRSYTTCYPFENALKIMHKERNYENRLSFYR